MPPTLEAVQRYKTCELTGAPSHKLMLQVYDYVIQQCLRKDAPRASKAIALLIDSLDFDKDIAVRFFELYEYAMRMVWEGEFDIVVHIFRELRNTWQEALSKAVA